MAIDRLVNGATAGVDQVGRGAPTDADPHAQALFSAKIAERTELLDGNIRGFIAEIEANNQKLGAVQDLKALLGHNDNLALSHDQVNLAKSLGIQVPTGPLDAGAQKSLKEKLDAKSEALANTSQLQTVKLQSNMNKYNQSFEMLSNFTNKWFNTINNIIGNIRG